MADATTRDVAMSICDRKWNGNDVQAMSYLPSFWQRKSPVYDVTAHANENSDALHVINFQATGTETDYGRRAKKRVMYGTGFTLSILSVRSLTGKKTVAIRYHHDIAPNNKIGRH